MQDPITESPPARRQSTALAKALSPSESAFLDALLDPFDEGNRLEQGAKCGLREMDVRFIEEWVLSQGIHWLTCENASLSLLDGTKCFRNPIVRKIINEAASRGLCVATSASKEELEDFYTQRVRNAFLPASVQDNAADKLAKLKGYYPSDKNQGGGAAIQINFVNPYANNDSEPGVQAPPISD